MEHNTIGAQTRPARRLLPIAMGAAFLLGAVLAGYGLWRFGPDFGFATAQPTSRSGDGSASSAVSEPLPSGTASAAAEHAVEAAQIVAEQQGGLDQRLAAAEQRIAQLDLQAQAAFGNAARAEGLLIAFSARRALERGNDLGFLADQLRLRFGDAMPNAVQTVIAFGDQPVTADQLIARLDGLAPELATPQQGLSWQQLSSELAQLFVVRHETTPSPQPRRRLERARLFLQSGRVDAAVAEVRNLPGAAKARNWIVDAERYAAAQNALDLIETAAVLEPRKLRDGQGRAIEQAGLANSDSAAAAAPARGAALSGAQ